MYFIIINIIYAIDATNLTIIGPYTGTFLALQSS
jgi:hypothetical protein